MWELLFSALFAAITNTTTAPAAIPHPMHSTGIEIGLSKAEVLRRFGQPEQADRVLGYLQFTYSGKLCQDDYSCFIGFDEANIVKTFNSFKPKYNAELAAD